MLVCLDEYAIKLGPYGKDLFRRSRRMDLTAFGLYILNVRISVFSDRSQARLIRAYKTLLETDSVYVTQIRSYFFCIHVQFCESLLFIKPEVHLKQYSIDPKYYVWAQSVAKDLPNSISKRKSGCVSRQDYTKFRKCKHYLIKVRSIVTLLLYFVLSLTILVLGRNFE